MLCGAPPYWALPIVPVVHCALRTVHCAVCIVHSALCFVHFVLGVAHLCLFAAATENSNELRNIFVVRSCDPPGGANGARKGKLLRVVLGNRNPELSNLPQESRARQPAMGILGAATGNGNIGLGNRQRERWGLCLNLTTNPSL